MPISLYEATVSNSWGQWQSTGLHLFAIKGLTGSSATLEDKGVVIAEQASAEKTYPQGGGHDRGIFHGEAVYFSHANDVFAANWKTPSDVTGPIKSVPVICTQHLAPSLSVNLTAPGGNACDATVKAFLTDYQSPAEYTLLPSGNGESCTFSGPDEIAGPFTIEASMNGFSTESAKTVVYKDACHVQTQYLEVMLEPTAVVCPEVRQPPSVTVFIYDDGFDTCDEYSVSVVQGEREYILEGISTQVATDGAMTLLPQGCNFSGAEGVSGFVNIVVNASGEQSQDLNGVLIEKDGACSVHSVTKYVAF